MTLKEALSSKYPAYAEKLAERFREANGVEMDWSNITKSSLARFAEHLQNEVSRSSARSYCAIVKATLSLYDDVVELPRGWQDSLRVRNEDSEQVYLTDDEIKMLLKYRPQSRNEEYVHTTFLIGCLTGARHSDYIRFTQDNISHGYLRYTSQKTRTSATLPVAPALPRLLAKLASLPENNMADTTFNRTIRDICMKSGITESMRIYRRGKESTKPKWTFVSSHTARRSFASNLYLRGCDIMSISMMMGHASVDMTRGYIVCGLRSLPDNVAAYFKQFH